MEKEHIASNVSGFQFPALDNFEKLTSPANE